MRNGQRDKGAEGQRWGMVLIAVMMLIAWSSRDSDNELQGRDLFGLDVFNTKPFQCGEQFHMRWVNDVGDLRIYQAQLWMGMYQGNVSDLGYQVHRVSDSSLLFRGNWDHYAEPVGIDGQLHTMNLTPNYFELKAGDALELWYKCQTPEDVGHIIVTVWFGEE